MSYEIIKKNYEKHLWNKGMVRFAGQKGVITVEQYEDIVGEPYTA